MKTLTKLEKSKACWYLIGLLLLFFFLRLPSLIEPDWYGDEGIYQTIGMALNHGQMLYSGAWDNKPPLLYLTYALFQGDLFAARTASLVVGMLTIGIFFAFSQKLFNNLRTSFITTLIFVIFFATPLIEGNIANAENFMLLPIIAAALLLFKQLEKTHSDKRIFLLSGLLLGIAFLFKIVALFDFAAFLVFLLILALPKKLSLPFGKLHHVNLKKIFHGLLKNPQLKNIILLAVGFFLPLIVTVSYFFMTNTLWDFLNAAFLGMFNYVHYGNNQILPQGFLYVKLLILACFIGALTFYRNKLSTSSLFILLWVGFSLFNAFFSQRPYTHYMLVALPAVCLLIGLVVNAKTFSHQRNYLLALITVVVLLLANFNLYGFKKTFLYYQNAIAFVSGQKDVVAYQTFFDGKTPRDYEVASFIKLHNKPYDRIFIWGNNAQIYVLSQTLPLNRYTVAYHAQNKEAIAETQRDIDTIKPKYVIILSEAPSFPFKLNEYTNKFSLDRAIIYERDF
jgi:4-amino-4-deoxy-L-arabinose transferase-like glycosyltransferase